MPQTQVEAYEELDALLDSAKFPEAIEKMRPWNKVWLHQFYETYPHRYTILKHADFNEFWAEKRAALYTKSEFKAQKNIADIDFVLGYVFYLLALKAKQSQPQAYIVHLKNALRFHSIHAAQTFFNELLKKPDSDKKLEEIMHLLDIWKKFGTQHGTPGFLLLANGYLQYARITAERKDYASFEKACTSLWENLTLAELNEPNSTDSIHNAYFGQGLTLSNPLEIDTIAALKEKASRLITDNSIKKRAEQNAESIFKGDVEPPPLLTWLQSRNNTRAPKPEEPHLPSPRL